MIKKGTLFGIMGLVSGAIEQDDHKPFSPNYGTIKDLHYPVPR